MDQTLLHRTAGTETGGAYFSFPNLRVIVTSSFPAASSICRIKQGRNETVSCSTQPEKKAVLTCQMPSALKVFRNSGSDPSLLDSFSYCSSSASFCESASSAAQEKKTGRLDWKNKRRWSVHAPSPILRAVIENALVGIQGTTLRPARAASRRLLRAVDDTVRPAEKQRIGAPVTRSCRRTRRADIFY
jgi:hypothetical protein